MELYKRSRDLLHHGTVVVADHPDPAIWVHGVVAPDQSEAIYGVEAVSRSTTWPPGRVRLPGLHPDRRYRVGPLPPGDRYPRANQLPDWWVGGVTMSGRVLDTVGVKIPAMYPEYLHLIRATEVPM